MYRMRLCFVPSAGECSTAFIWSCLAVSPNSKPDASALKLRTLGWQLFWTKAIHHRSLGRRPGEPQKTRPFWPTAIFMAFRCRCVWPLAKGICNAPNSWGGAPGYGEKWPSATEHSGWHRLLATCAAKPQEVISISSRSLWSLPDTGCKQPVPPEQSLTSRRCGRETSGSQQRCARNGLPACEGMTR
ncbi:MAG: hypothetical protein ACI92S_002752 [Planctomycetaceae bacterium]|jgi:hypothetical protein